MLKCSKKSKNGRASPTGDGSAGTSAVYVPSNEQIEIDRCQYGVDRVKKNASLIERMFRQDGSAYLLVDNAPVDPVRALDFFANAYPIFDNILQINDNVNFIKRCNKNVNESGREMEHYKSLCFYVVEYFNTQKNFDEFYSDHCSPGNEKLEYFLNCDEKIVGQRDEHEQLATAINVAYGLSAACFKNNFDRFLDFALKNRIFDPLSMFDFFSRQLDGGTYPYKTFTNEAVHVARIFENFLDTVLHMDKDVMIKNGVTNNYDAKKQKFKLVNQLLYKLYGKRKRELIEKILSNNHKTFFLVMVLFWTFAFEHVTMHLYVNVYHEKLLKYVNDLYRRNVFNADYFAETVENGDVDLFDKLNVNTFDRRKNLHKLINAAKTKTDNTTVPTVPTLYPVLN